MRGAFVPNTASVSVGDPADLSLGQNWYASVLGQRMRSEPFDILSLDMYSGMWPVFSVHAGGVPSLAQPVELNYAGRIAKLGDSLAVLRHNLPAGALIATNGGQIDMALGRFLPSLEEGRPLPPDVEGMIHYSIGSFLLLRARDTAYTYISIGYVSQLLFTSDPVFAVALPAEVDLPLGRPLHAASGTIDSLRVEGRWEGLSLQGPVYARRYMNGVVLANPSSRDAVEVVPPAALRHRVSFRGFGYLSTDATFKDFSGHSHKICTSPIQAATLPPASALVLLESPLAEEGCPAPW
jgi:hypothetical protein